MIAIQNQLNQTFLIK